MQIPRLPRLIGSIFILFVNHCYGQSTAVQSAVINFGTNTCGNNNNVTFSSVGKPNANPYLISSCGLGSIFSDVNNKFIAYNPKDNKIYINDISHGDSRVYIYDMGLPNNYTCPAAMPQVPAYQYSYVPNNWEFDINGNVWCIKGLTGNTAIIETIDETTGTILTSKTLDFPAGNIPNTLGSGDIVITPNGRLFIAMGNSPTKFFEVTNYITNTSHATANFIQDMPKSCYGILYLNGTIELTGTDFGSTCYKYLYDIPSGVMKPEQSFELGLTPVDNSSISPATGLSKELLGSTVIDGSTADIVYKIFAKNLGNVRLNNFNILEDLGTVFGQENVSNVIVNMDPGSNPGNLALNPNFDGVHTTRLFMDNQILSNLTNGNVGVTISLRVHNLVTNKVYNNSARSVGEIGEEGVKVSVADSSNNGFTTAIDPNNDGDAGDVGENVPTPFFFGIVLPISFIDISAVRKQGGPDIIKWTPGGAQDILTKFDVEYTENHTTWQVAGTVPAKQNKTSYFLNRHVFTNNTMWYRIRAYEKTGKNYQSREARIVISDRLNNLTIRPNPADVLITVYLPEGDYTKDRMIYIVNAAGKKIYEHSFITKNIYIDCSRYPEGYYVINIADKGTLSSSGILIRHH